MDRLEREVKAGTVAVAPKPPPERAPEPPPTEPVAEATAASTEEVAGPPPEEAGTRPAASEPVEVTLAEFSAVWPVIVSRVRSDFGARRHAFVRVAEPRSVEGSVAVLTMPSHQHFHLEQLNADDELRTALESIAAELLGGVISLRFVSDEDPAPTAAEEPARAPDPGSLDDGPEPEDPTDMVVDMLGGTIVEDS